MHPKGFRVYCSPVMAAALVCQGSCAGNPGTGGRQPALISEGREIAIGRESHPEIVAEFGIEEGAFAVRDSCGCHPEDAPAAEAA